MSDGPEAVVQYAYTDAAFLTSLDPPETNPQSAEIQPSIGLRDFPVFAPDPLDVNCRAVDFRHSGWAHDRRRVYDALRRTHQTGNRLAGFRECGKNAFVYESVDRPGEYTIGGSSCHDRFCLPCARERSRIIAQNVLQHIAGKQSRFLTLTLHSTSEPLAQLLEKLTHDFTLLRRTKLWRNKVVGGVAFLEIKWSAKLQRWHPHLHCMLQGRYLPQRELSELWLQVTGTSRILDIRYVSDQAHVTHYITKYASKPLDHTVTMQPGKLDEAVNALKGKRLCLTFGTWRGLVLTEPPDDGQWVNIGSLVELIDRAETGEHKAAEVLRTLQVSFAVRVRGSPLTTVTDVDSRTCTQSTFSFAREKQIPWDV